MCACKIGGVVGMLAQNRAPSICAGFCVERWLSLNRRSRSRPGAQRKSSKKKKVIVPHEVSSSREEEEESYYEHEILQGVIQPSEPKLKYQFV